MSVDNWGVCPVCHDRTVRNLQRAAADAAEARDGEYGRASQDHWLHLAAVARSAAEEAEDAAAGEPEHGTLREDYELGVGDGEFYLFYKAACEGCGLRLDLTATADPVKDHWPPVLVGERTEPTDAKETP